MTLQTLIESCLEQTDGLALARQQAVVWEPWLQVLEQHPPVGVDPGYHDDFQQMREELDKLSGVNAARVGNLAQTLLTDHCKDLRVATYYVWARLHQHGEAGLADGLMLVAALVDRFGCQLLPARAHGRKAALEWLAGSKVLASLSLYPEVAKADAQRTAAALVWLNHSLAAWPTAQQPDLAPLHAALAQRVAQAGGVNALVPQTSASGDASSPPLAAIQSGRDLLEQGRVLAIYLREQPLGWLAAHRLMKTLRWDTLQKLPPLGAQGHTRLAPPRPDYRAQLRRLYLQQAWSELLELAERVFAEGVNHFWLDLQWYLFQALSKQPEPQAGWAAVVAGDLGLFLQRLSGLEALCWSDGTPLADASTREWIAHQVCPAPRQWLPAAAPIAAAADDILALEGEALAQADSDGVEAALAWLAARPDIHSGRQRWLLRLLMARVAEQCGRSELAIHLLEELDQRAEQLALLAWEPELGFEVKVRLLKLLRSKSVPYNGDKSLHSTRMHALLAALVAIDPLRAAVLCG
ncbi:type VI secretion system protein TssA [Pseudomonas turukhanskensis]|uniref:Type VI secretion-associated protein n=1 Tax=Pseudomonas turukhanskensis TaxID=1806536 RepID=A0A9W6NFY0_9PSED|nr:type VI secretion system protein TssA [Pseudomonas turukhanskensis]GLK89275.1 type VI secretion-associated protein [Pseudomonas turukhanskensis]